MQWERWRLSLLATGAGASVALVILGHALARRASARSGGGGPVASRANPRRHLPARIRRATACRHPSAAEAARDRSIPSVVEEVKRRVKVIQRPRAGAVQPQNHHRSGSDPVSRCSSAYGVYGNRATPPVR